MFYASIAAAIGADRAFRPTFGESTIMPIRPFLAGQAFEPEVIREMSFALETVCGKFGMKLTDEPATRVIASKIIELAQRGVRDAPTITEMTLKELKHYLPFA
jgi:hypothetical protein